LPWVSAELNASFFDIAAQGPVAQSAVPQDQVPFGPTTIANAGQFSTGVLVSDGYKIIGVGVTSSNSGALIISRFLDREGTILVTTALSTPIVAATPLIVVVPNPATPADNLPFASFTITITNTGGGSATISKFYCLLQAS
jgi:hypothetical protein